ncbi:MAG TPA: DUF6567 family protein [Candidatus Limnocylindria bacterium]|nr:DUF6567 family protein [Candidatus Limnocylindria bacterium]
MKYAYWVLCWFPLAVLAQLPIPLTPDWLKPASSSAQILSSTHVTLTGNNFRIVETNVIGKSRGFKLLGLITLKPVSYTRAMSRLYDQAQVEPGRPQALANVVHESSSIYLILFSLPKITIRADLIEFTGVVNNDTDHDEPVASRVRDRYRSRQR